MDEGYQSLVNEETKIKLVYKPKFSFQPSDQYLSNTGSALRWTNP